MELPMFYNEVEEWNRALLLYDAALKEINTKLEILNNEFKMAHQYNPIEHITSRVKSLQSIAKKIRRKNQELTVENIVKHVNDVAGIRIICSFASDIYRIADLLTKQNDVKVLKVKDYIVSPKPNGYMSYHMIITVPIFLANDVVETKVEVQIRTIAMDFWASLEHKIYYKFEGNAPAHIREDLKECAQIVSYLDKKMLMINDEVRALEQGDYNEEEYQQRKSEPTYFESVKDYYGKLSEDEGREVIIEHDGISEEIEFSEEEAPDAEADIIAESDKEEAQTMDLVEMPEYIGTPEDIGIEKWGSLAIFLENRRKLKYNRCEMTPASAGRSNPIEGHFDTGEETMRLFSKESSRERLRPAEQAVSRLTEQRHQAAQAQKVAKERLQAERQAAKEKQEAEQQAVKKKEAEYQTTKEKLQEAERQVTEWKAVAADYKESLEQYEIGYRQIFESLEQLKEQQEEILFLKEKQEYMLKNFSTLEGNIVDKLKGAQANSTQELLRRMEEIAHVQKRRNIWNKVLLVLSLLCSMTAVGGILVLLLYFSDRLAL